MTGQRRTDIKDGPDITVERWLRAEVWLGILGDRTNTGLRLRPDECRSVAGHLLAVAEEIEAAEARS